MTTDEKEALLGYLEFNLTTMVEGLEKQRIVDGQEQVGKLYDAAYEVLHEMERTLNDYLELRNQENMKLT
jgi:hypothetical protein